MTSTMTNEFLDFMVERDNIRRRKEEGQPWPWTDNPILREFKFTNVKRLHDRTTQAFLKIYDAHPDAPPDEYLYNCATYRWFGTAAFAQELGWQHQHDTRALLRAVRKLNARDESSFTGAYVISNFGRGGPKENIIAEVLGNLWARRRPVLDAIKETNRWQAAYDALRKINGFGGSGFMSKEVLQDCLLTPLLATAYDRDSWTPVGPGARRGLNRVHRREYNARLNEAQAVEECLALWKDVRDRWPFADMTLTAHDIQFQLCEFDKMQRVVEGQGRPRSRYHRPGV